MEIRIKNSANTGNAPSSLANGELAINRADGRLFYKHANGTIVFLATGGGGAANTFSTVNVAGQSDIVADSNNDTLTLISGTGIAITTDVVNDAVTITATGGAAFDQFARDTANGAFVQANSAALRANTLVTDNVPETTSNLYFTAARVRANVSNTAPINYNPSTGAFSHAVSGVGATTYGNTTNIPQITVDDKGHIIAASNVSISGLPAATANGQLLIGNTVSGTFDVNPLTAGYATSIVNDKGSVTIASTGDPYARAHANAAYTQANVATTNADAAFAQANVGTTLAQTARDHANSAYAQANTGATLAQTARDHANGAYAHANGAFSQANVANTIAGSAALRANTLVTDNISETTSNLYFTAARVRANISNTAPINYNPITGAISHKDSGVTPTTYGNASFISQITVDATGHMTSVSNVAIDQSLAQGAYTQANSATTTGQVAFDKANSANALAQTARDHANGAFIKANAATPNTVTANGQVYIGNTVSGQFDLATLTAGPNITITNNKGAITIEAATGAAEDQFARDRANGAFSKANAAVANSGVTVNGAILIGNTVSGGYDLRTLTQGAGTLITNGQGTVTITSNVQTVAGRTGTVTLDTSDVAESVGGPFYHTAARVRGNVTNVAPINYDGTTGVFSHADSGVAATTYGNASFVPQVTVDFKGHITGVSNVEIDQTLTQAAFNKANIATTNADAAFAQANTGTTLAQTARDHANGAFTQANGAIYTSAQIRANISNAYPVYYNQTTGVVSFVPATANGQVLIGNTVSGSFDVATLTAGYATSITNDKGSITIASSGDTYARAHANAAYAQANIATTNADAAFAQANVGATLAQTARDHANGAFTQANTGTTLAQTARDHANGAFNQANVANTIATSAALRANTLVTDNVPETTTNLYFTAARVRANITNTAPINYDASTGNISHADSGVAAGTYGDTTHVPRITIDDKGHITTVSSVIISGGGGGGGSLPAASVNGELLIGNTVSGNFESNTLVQGPGMLITLAPASITLAANVISVAGKTGAVTLVTDNVTETTTNLYFTAARVRANISNTAPINYDSATGVISHADSSVTATTYGNASFVSQVTVDAKGHVTSVSNVAIDQTLAQAAFNQANVVYANANTAIYTATQIRANISNAAPIDYDATTGIISHAASGVTATSYGLANSTPTFVVDAKGHVTSATNTAIAIDASQVTTGTFAVVRGGTGQSTYQAGDLLIGNTISGGLDKSNLTAGYGVSVTNGNGAITISTLSGRTYYLITSQQANIATYNVASTNPSSNAEQTIAASLSGTSFSLLRDFITDPGEPGTSLLPAGTYGRHIHATTGAANDNAQIRVELYKRMANGTEVVLRSDDSPIFNSGTSSQLLSWTITDGSSYSLDVTDRLVFKVYGRRTSGAATITLTLYFEGSTRATYFPTTILSVSADTFARTQANAAFAKANAAVPNNSITVNGSMLIGNTVSGAFDVNTLTQGTGIAITNDKGSITIAATGDQYARDTANGAFAKANAATPNTATANGQLYIGNTVSGGFDLATLTQGTNITITNDKGSITIASTGGTDQYARDTANGAFIQANAAYANANTAIYTATQIRTNITNTSPINYDATTGTVSHASSGVTATTYGNASHISSVTVDQYGHVTAASNNKVSIAAAQITSGATANGQILIGNTVSGAFDVNTIAQSAPVIVTNDKGTITLSHARSGVTATGYGDAATLPLFVVDANGHITSATNTAIAIAASQITSGILSVARGGSGKDATGLVNGALLIGNTVNSGFDLTTITAGFDIGITNGKGTITVASTGDSFARPQANAAYNQANTGTTLAQTARDHANGAFNKANVATPNTAAANGQIYAGNTVSGAFDLTTIAQTAPVIVVNGKGTITLSHASSGVVATGYGTAAQVPVFVVDQYGHVTSVTNTAIAITTASVSEDAAGPFYHTSARVRGNVTNTAPINYDSTTGTFSHATSGVTATGYGNGTTVATVVVNGTGHVTSVVNTAIAIDASAITSGTLSVSRGGTGNTLTPANGVIPIGNTVSGAFDFNTLTQGTGIVITNDKGSITIAATGGGATDQFARDQANAAFNKANAATPNTATANGQIYAGNTVSGQFDLTTIAQTAPVIVTNGKGTITLSHASSGVTATGYGTQSQIPVFVVDQYGHITSVTNTAIGSLDTGVLTTGILSVARGGTGKDATGLVNGALLIGNTVNSGFDLTTITAGFDIGITNGKGTITVASTGDSFARPQANAAFDKANAANVLAQTARDQANAAFNKANAATPNTATANGQIYAGNTVSGAFDLTTIAQTAPVIVTNGRGTITLSHASSGVVATGYGTAAAVPAFVVDQYGHVTAVTNTAIAGLDTSVLTTGILSVARGGTGKDATGLVNGALLIGNTVNSGFDLTTVTGLGSISVVNGKGTITINSNTFAVVNVAMAGQANLTAVGADTLILAAGVGMNVITDMVSGDRVTLNVNPGYTMVMGYGFGLYSV